MADQQYPEPMDLRDSRLGTGGLEVTDPQNEPYFEGSAAKYLPQGTAPVVLDGRGYIIDRKSGKYRRLSENVIGQRDARAGEAGTIQTDIYRRSFESWHLGAGQVFADRDGSNGYQYQESKGVDPWEKFYLTLLPDTDLVDSHGGRCVVVGEHLAHVHNAALDWRGDLHGAAVEAVLPSDAVSISSDGTHLFAALESGAVVKVAEGQTTVDAVAAGAYTLVGCVKGRVVACQGGTVYDLTSGTAEIVWVHPDPGWTWNAVGDGLTAVYLSGFNGDKSGVYRFRSKEDGTGLDVGIQAAQLPDGERCVHVGYYLGYMVVGTTLGVRFGSSDSQGNIVLGSLLETPHPVVCSEGQGRFVWFGWSDFDAVSTGLGRMDPSKFTEPLTPAYASDLMADGQGNVLSVATFKGKRVFTVSGLGLFAEAERRVESGWITSGHISWNVPDTKRGAYVMVRHAPLAGSVSVEVSLDNAPWVRIGDSYTQGTTASENLTLQGWPFSAINVRVTLGRAEPVGGPVLTRCEVRAVPTSGRASVWQVPLVIAERDEWAGATRSVNVSAEVSHLAGLCETGKPTVYREGDSSWQVHMIDYEWQPEKQTSDGRGWGGVFLAVLRELK